MVQQSGCCLWFELVRVSFVSVSKPSTLSIDTLDIGTKVDHKAPIVELKQTTRHSTVRGSECGSDHAAEPDEVCWCFEKRQQVDHE